jgi:hypothetical protein
MIDNLQIKISKEHPLKVGEPVQHPEYGKGKVTALHAATGLVVEWETHWCTWHDEQTGQRIYGDGTPMVGNYLTRIALASASEQTFFEATKEFSESLTDQEKKDLDDHLFEDKQHREEQRLANEVLAELRRARSLYPAQASAHEGYAVLLEEMDELWDAIKLRQSHPGRNLAIRDEAIQVAAMAMRLIIDTCTDADKS